MAPNHFILSYHLPKQGHAVLTLATDINLPGTTRNSMKLAPAFVRENLAASLPAGSVLPSTYAMEFPALPAHLGQLASYLLARLSPARQEALTLHLAEASNNTASPAGNPYEDDGWFVAGGDRLLSWMLAHPYGMQHSPNPLAAALATQLHAFLAGPERERLLARAELFTQFSELVGHSPERKHQDVRQTLRAAMAMMSEYQGWEQVNPADPTIERLVPHRGRGMLRALAEATAGRLAAGDPATAGTLQQQYLHQLADQLAAAVSSPEPLPYAYPANRSRVPLTQPQLNKALAH